MSTIDTGLVPPPVPRLESAPNGSMFTLERRARIVASIRAGSFKHVAAQAAGVSRQTFRNWLNDPRPEYQAFAYEVAQAEAQARERAEVRVANADPRFWLTRGPGRDKGPEDPGWSDTVQHQLTGAGGGPIELAPGQPRVDLNKLSTEELQVYRALVAKAAPVPALPDRTGSD